ncbi:kinase-like domain-containing protein [Xylaria arbuscula]|nr:kinase-like domain-containing protein [Xylaria arbuscula]
MNSIPVFCKSHSGGVPECQDPVKESTELTNPFSTGHIERQLEFEAQKTVFEPEDVQMSQDCPIASLDSDHLNCRVLIQPKDPKCFDCIGFKWVNLLPHGMKAPSNGAIRDVRCVAVYETPDQTSCCVREPWNCEIFFGPYDDFVAVLNLMDDPLSITSLNAGGGRNKCITIPAYTAGNLEPGAWAFNETDVQNSLQVLVFHRTHVLKAQMLSVQRVAGHKRDAIEEPQSDVGHLASATAARSLGCLSELADQETAYLFSLDTAARGYENLNYTLFGMRKKGGYIISHCFRSTALRLRQASHSQFSVHRNINCDYIVKLLGWDSRIHSLFSESVAAEDLSKEKWCNKPDKRFKGTPAHALRILNDMGQALQYLHQKMILHNDIKPSNILFSGAKAILIDFGLGGKYSSSTCTGGTPWYVPPEFLAHHERKGPSDMWALGIVMLYALRQVSLLDYGRDVKMWIISKMLTDESPACMAARRWFQIVEHAAKHLVTGDQLCHLVLQMLEPQPKNRIKPDNLVRSVKALAVLETSAEPLYDTGTNSSSTNIVDGSAGRLETNSQPLRNRQNKSKKRRLDT